MSLFWQSLPGYQHSSKKGVATDLGVNLALGEAKDLGNNISTSHWFMPINNRSGRIVSIASILIWIT
jgi:hypothetical protein